MVVEPETAFGWLASAGASEVLCCVRGFVRGGVRLGEIGI